MQYDQFMREATRKELFASVEEVDAMVSSTTFMAVYQEVAKMRVDLGKRLVGLDLMTPQGVRAATLLQGLMMGYLEAMDAIVKMSEPPEQKEYKE